jgi:hypothetical protein
MPEKRTVSAYHNYLVHGKLHMEFVAGKPEDPDGFSLLAHRVVPGEPMPLISGLFFNQDGDVLARMERNALVENPAGLLLEEQNRYLGLVDALGNTLISAKTRVYANTYMTVLEGDFFDKDGTPLTLRDEPALRLTA